MLHGTFDFRLHRSFRGIPCSRHDTICVTEYGCVIEDDIQSVKYSNEFANGNGKYFMCKLSFYINLFHSTGFFSWSWN
jgi:hypothetical protein